MGQEESKPMETEDMHAIRELKIKGGVAAVYSHIEQNINKWKSEPVRFAITGLSGTGKSSFINAVRGVKKGNEYFAKEEFEDTTPIPTVYYHPKYKNIQFWELPGIGTINVPVETYLKIMELDQYDFFFIFFPDVINQDDVLLAKEIIKLKKIFCFVRSKIDIDLESYDLDDVTEEEKMAEIKQKAEKFLESDNDLRTSSAIFYISSRKPTIGDMDVAMKYIEQRLPSVNREAFVNALACISERIIDEKYKQLASRRNKVTALIAAVDAVPDPGLDDLKVNTYYLSYEVKHYMEVFGLTSKRLEDIDTDKMIGFRCKSILLSPLNRLHSSICEYFEKTYSSRNIRKTEKNVETWLSPLVGVVISSVTTAQFVYSFLSTQLEDFRKDASLVYINTYK